MSICFCAQSKGTSNAFPPAKFTFSFSKRLPLCLIWRFQSTDRFIYSAGGEGPFQSSARGDKVTADCQSNSMLNTFSSKLVGLRLRCHSVHTLPTLSLNPFSCFYIVRECVYPASLPLMRGPGPSGAGRTETEGKKLLCSIRVIHAVLNLDTVTTAYCLGKYCIFHTVHISRSRHSVTQLFPSISSFSRKLSHVQY